MWASHMGCLLQPAEPDKHTSMRTAVWEQGMTLVKILCVDRMGGLGCGGIAAGHHVYAGRCRRLSRAAEAGRDGPQVQFLQCSSRVDFIKVG